MPKINLGFLNSPQNFNIKKNISKKTTKNSSLSKYFYKRKKFTTFIKNKICAKQKWKCNFCNEILSDTFIIDHIIPLFLGGSNEEYNLQSLCNSCDRYKSSYLDNKVLKPLSLKKNLLVNDVLEIQKEHYYNMSCKNPYEYENELDNNFYQKINIGNFLGYKITLNIFKYR